MAKIKTVRAREILDSRGNPTIEVDVLLTNGRLGRAAVPSGASTGKREAVELRDGDSRYLGKGVRKAVRAVNRSIAPKMVGMDPRRQSQIDGMMVALDGTDNKSRLGANAILGVSLASAHAAAADDGRSLYDYLGKGKGRVLPVPMMNIVNGGAHADNNLDFQEFMIVPIGRSFRESLRHGSEVFHSLKARLRKGGLSTSVGDEGGFAPKLRSHEQALELILDASEDAGMTPGKDLLLALDVASSEFYDGSRYHFRKSSKKRLSSDSIAELYESMCARYPIVSIEDPMSEDDWDGWRSVTDLLGGKVQLVGDDVFVTNRAIVEEGARLGVANAVLVKVNQIGSLTETLETMAFAESKGYRCVVSHRSGETEDTTISDLSVATNAGQIKAGAPSRGERTAKYNQLLRIEEELGGRARFLGRKAFGL
ncbi:MAG: phosphopyruvate hydratase [Thermoplasmata archaeon]|nr:phosphopyruvate hydratase [Thermoplasmata archaeon]